MEDLLSKIFDKVVFYERDGIQFGKEYDAQVEELLEPLRATKPEAEVEDVKELVYAASYHANGIVKGEGIGITNTREGKYAKSSGYAVQNTGLKMAKKIALVDAALNVGNLSARFMQDVEDMNIESDNVSGKHPEELKKDSKPKSDKPVTQKQLNYLETLMSQYNTSPEAMSKYTINTWGIDDYKKISGVQCSQLIDKFKVLESQ